MTSHTGRIPLYLAFVSMCFAVSGAKAAAQDAAALWQQIGQAPFDTEKSAAVENVTLVRDRIRITLATGTIQFSNPAQDIVYGAAFRGKGRIEVKPPTPQEAQQLRLFTGQESLAMDFTEATFTFSDGTYEEVARQVHWSPTPDKAYGELYLRRQQEREDIGFSVVPRLFKSILSGDRKRTALFVADLKTSEKGWIHASTDALSLEEITVGRYADYGPVVRLDTWLSFPAGERGAAEAYADPLAREDFDIKKFHIDAKVTAGAELSAVTQVALAEKAAGERVLLFNLDATLRVQSVKNKEGSPLAFFQPRDPKDRNQSYGDYVAVVLPAASVPGESQTLEFTYAGKRIIQKTGNGSYFCQSYGWYPSLPVDFATRADFEMTFHSPKGYTLVATGSRVSATTEGDSVVTNWKSNPALAVAGFAFGRFKLYTEKTGNVTIEAYANPEPDDMMNMIQRAAAASNSVAVGTLTPSAMIKPMGSELGNIVRLFESYFGPYPYDRLAVTNIPASYGQGWPTLIYLSVLSFLDSTQRNALGITGSDVAIELTDFFRAHEASHQWWGHRVGWKSYHDAWLSEGFAQFSGNLYVQYRQNDKEYLNRIKQDKEKLLGKDDKGRVYESIGPVWMGERLSSADAPRAYANVVYNKGGLIVHMLRRLLWNSQSSNPDDRFSAMLKDYCQTYNNKPASTEDFKAILEKHMIPAMDLEGNRRMDWFFRQYVYGTGVPEYQLQWQADDAGGGQWKLQGKIMQSGVRDGWLDVLPLYAQVSGKVIRLGLLSVKGKETQFSFTLPLKPEKLLLNYLEDTLAMVR
ncbi:MAG: hypothetical protein LAP85_26255 [Acidobacteriia bacterium]|nr:hypothetical protein [Terriglobia bacterium]